jgi:hypothetical protein
MSSVKILIIEQLTEKVVQALGFKLSLKLDDESWSIFISKVLQIEIALNKEYSLSDTISKILEEYTKLIKK